MKSLNSFLRAMLAPGIAFMDRLRYARKFALIGVVLVAPLAFVVVSYLSVQSRDTAFAQKEEVGLVYLRPTTGLLSALVHARTAAVQQAAGRGAMGALAGARSAVGAAVAAVEQADAQAAALGLAGDWTKLKGQIQSGLAAPVGSAPGAPARVYASYSSLITGTEALIADDGNNSNMILDPDNDSYYVMDAVLNRLPVLVDDAGQAGDEQTIITSSGRVTLAERLTLEDLKSAVETTLSNSDPDYATALQNTHYGAMKSLLRGPWVSSDSTLSALTGQLARAVHSGAVNGANATALGAAAQTAALALDTASLPVIHELLQTRIGGFNGASLLTESVTGVALMFALYLFASFYFATTATVGRLVRVADGIAGGDTAQTLSVSSRDELGTMAAAFGRSIEYLGEMAAVAGQIAAGNLAVEVNVRSERDALGVAFTDMRARLTALLAEISSTTRVVTSASAQMAQTSSETSRAISEISGAIESVAEGAETQVRSLERAQTVTAELSSATTASSQEVGAAADQADTARRLAADGAAAVAQATDAMRAVQTTSSQVTQAIRRLGAKSEQIGSIVSTITGIAEQTNLLALNAAIEAARAAEHGRGFAVVAEEVRKLAEESGQAAASISELIAEIQRETGSVVDIVVTGERQTEEGAQTVQRAYDAFVRIDESVQAMNGRVGQIAAAIEQIAGAGARMEESVSSVAAVAEESSAATEQVSASTQQTSAASQQISASAQMLAASAESLDQLVGQFRLS